MQQPDILIRYFTSDFELLSSFTKTKKQNSKIQAGLEL